jgi:nicotinate-nucleotide adenylyltransferase
MSQEGDEKKRKFEEVAANSDNKNETVPTAEDPVVSGPPVTIGVFGGSFNPIHLGHVLLAITVKQTKAVDHVVLVPVYKHAVKRDLLPFDDRVAMCRLSIGGNAGMSVSTIERDIGESNGAMLKGLKKRYPPGSRFLWICGDDFIRWMDRPKGLETLCEVDGLIVQRRLHRADDDDDDNGTEDRFYKMPLDEQKMRRVAAQLDLDIDVIYGELPHFSSTLVRKAPGNWKSFLPQSVGKYLDAHPHLLKQLLVNLESDAKSENAVDAIAFPPLAAAAAVLRGLDVVHALQHERGRTGLFLSMGTLESKEMLREAQASTDAIVQEIQQAHEEEQESLEDFDEVLGLAAELQYIPVWLERDRAVSQRHGEALAKLTGVDGWNKRFALVEKFNPRVDLLVNGTVRALSEILEFFKKQKAKQPKKLDATADSLLKWCQGKEALGRLRAFVCAGGPMAPWIVRESLEMRERVNQKIETKERKIALVLPLSERMKSQQKKLLSAPSEALYHMLEEVTVWEWSLMECFASSTPISLVHKLVASKDDVRQANLLTFDVEKFFHASTSAIDFLLTFAKALAASGCAGGY